MMTATNRLDLPGFSTVEANELEHVDGGDKCVGTYNPKTGYGIFVCRSDADGSAYLLTIKPRPN
jgi:hypothetical protein